MGGSEPFRATSKRHKVTYFVTRHDAKRAYRASRTPEYCQRAWLGKKFR
jgi:hypothetical protein